MVDNMNVMFSIIQITWSFPFPVEQLSLYFQQMQNIL
jgi:hypothetical protein